jgi:hypothetical protein
VTLPRSRWHRQRKLINSPAGRGLAERDLATVAFISDEQAAWRISDYWDNKR